jgi:hypothetical protein
MTDRPTAAAPPSAPRRMSTFRKAAIVLGVLALLGAVAAFVALRATQGPVDAANRFLKLNATDGPAAAFAAASPGFQAAGAEAAWEQYARTSGLTQYTSASWNNREVSANGIAKLSGSIATTAGATLPVTIELVKASGGWRVQTLKLTPAGFGGDAMPATAPAPSPGGTGGAVRGWAGGSSPAPAPAPLPGYPSDLRVSPPPGLGAGSGSGRLGAVVPANATPIPGAKVAGTCKQRLLETTGIDFDSIECPTPLSPQAGSTVQCRVGKRAQTGTMTVTTGAYDPATQRVDFTCTVGAPQ